VATGDGETPARIIAVRIAYAVVAALVTTGVWIGAIVPDPALRALLGAAGLLVVAAMTAGHALLAAADVRRELAESQQRTAAALAEALRPGSDRGSGRR